jgi:hypothetical protein
VDRIVKIVDYGAVSEVQRPADPVVSARIQHALFERNDDFRPARARTPPRVHRRYIFTLTAIAPGPGHGLRVSLDVAADATLIASLARELDAHVYAEDGTRYA